MAKKASYSNVEIAELLRSVAAAYTLNNENRFKIIAYEKAADSVEHLNRELYDLWQEDKLDQVPGLGKSIQASLEEYFKTGHSKHIETVIGSIPKPVFLLMRVPSVGPKTAFKLVKELGLEKTDTIFDDILKAAQKNFISTIPTFGEKSQSEIAEAIKRFQADTKKEYRMPLPYAHRLAMKIIDYLKKNKAIVRIDALGSLRRMSATIGDIDIAVAVKDGAQKEIIEYFLAYPGKIAIDNAGEAKASIILPPNIRVDILVVDQGIYGSALQYFTGNKAHNIRLREQAIKKGYSLSEHGIKNIESGKVKEFSDEENFYSFLGYQYIPPELRDGSEELELARSNKLPTLVEIEDIKGDLHSHSSYQMATSHDYGANSYEELLEQAEDLGYEYMGFSDHNPKISGITKEEIVSIMKKRSEDIQKLAKNKKVTAFISLETDILPTGELALPEEAFQYVDYLIVSIHSSFKMNREEMTERVLKALSYPKVKILAHPTGRLLGKRNGYELEWGKIFEYAAKKNIALEINSWPERLDLPDSLVKEALKYNLKFTIDTDAHAVPDMLNMRYGVAVARRGWATKNDIINTMPLKAFKEWLTL
ncbi:MAG: DNA polymerase/3'-5' exonuclease PolX [Patescibacteria group bacterium]